MRGLLELSTSWEKLVGACVRCLLYVAVVVVCSGGSKVDTNPPGAAVVVLGLYEASGL